MSDHRDPHVGWHSVEHALATVAGIGSIHASAEDGSILATVEVDGTAGDSTVEAILDRYAIEWKVMVRK